MDDSAHPPVRWNEGRSLHIGLNQVSRDVFGDLLPDLRAAENDALVMRDLVSPAGVSARVVLGSDATLAGLRDVLSATIERLVPGDFFLLSFAGHGLSLRGAGTDADGFDEAWCLFDGLLLDDELTTFLAAIPEGCEVVVVTDACFAAGAVDDQDRVLQGIRSATPESRGPASISVADFINHPIAPDPYGHDEVLGGLSGLMNLDAMVAVRSSLLLAAGVSTDTWVATRGPVTRAADAAIAALFLAGRIPPGPQRYRGPSQVVAAEVVALAASAEGELAFEGPEHGLFTAALMTVLNRTYAEGLSYADLMAVVRAAVVLQTPSLGSRGATPQTLRLAPALEMAALRLTPAGKSESPLPAGG